MLSILIKSGKTPGPTREVRSFCSVYVHGPRDNMVQLFMRAHPLILEELSQYLESVFFVVSSAAYAN